MLQRAGVAFRGDCYAQPDADGCLQLMPDGAMLDAERVVALPTIEGPQISGVPGDDRGFIPVDDHGRVQGLSDVYAAGDDLGAQGCRWGSLAHAAAPAPRPTRGCAAPTRERHRKRRRLVLKTRELGREPVLELHDRAREVWPEHRRTVEPLVVLC